MKRTRHPSSIPAGALLLGALAVAAVVPTLPLPAAAASAEPGVDLPWRQAGWSEREAAAHLLDRLAYGARPGDVDRLLELGLDRWVEQQLAGDLPDPAVERHLERAKSLGLSARELSTTYPQPGLVLRRAVQEGVIDRDQAAAVLSGERDGEGRRRDPRQRREILRWAREQGYRPQREALGELMAQKLVRAVHSENQLTEVLTDFWFNHFNVSITDNQARIYVWPYERDAIRPHVLGDFRAMLEATAKHPAMLHYLDNVRSVAAEGAPTTLEARLESLGLGRRGLGRMDRGRTGRGRMDRGRMGRDRIARDRTGEGMSDEARRLFEQNRPRGLNENYARELLELHTLGVDGGYDQDDVREVARAFTGWATYPPGPLADDVKRRVERAQRFPRAGFVVEDTFVFRADVHDAGAKTVLGHALEAGRGIEDGLEVLDLVAAHPSTARHLARKLAVRFVADEPPASLVERLSGAFLDSGGDLRRVMRELLESPEFWSPEARSQKIKSPFELAASALRALDARLQDPRGAIRQVERMGQPLYAYQAPTGYPDRADAWVNTGALLGRMNFGLQLATGRVPGVDLDLRALVGGREPESAEDALVTYVPLLLPERDPEETVARLLPVIRDPRLAERLDEAAPEPDDPLGADSWDDWAPDEDAGPRGRGRRFFERPLPAVEVDSSALAHVVGVILGSPEFQRR